MGVIARSMEKMIEGQQATVDVNIATRINNEHRRVAAGLRSALEAARRCGELLLEAKADVEYGHWLTWLESNFEGSERTARGYMRIADRWSEIEVNRQHVADLTLREALKLLAGPRNVEEFPAFDYDRSESTDPMPVVTQQLSAEQHPSSYTNQINENREANRVPQRHKNWITLEEWNEIDPDERPDIFRTVFPSATMNRQDNASIEWAQWSWNPVTGCKHDCPYCYARDIAERFYPQEFTPSIIPQRLRMPDNTEVPAKAEADLSFKNVFTCSMADLFGRWVPREWIEAVLESVRRNPQWNFLFLTKFPKRLAEFDFPENAWLGTTVDLQARVKNAEAAFSRISGGTKWLSLEPLLEPLKFDRLDMFDWVVIGGASRSNKTPEWVPPLDWIVELHAKARDAGCKIYYKDNTKLPDDLRLREFPWVDRAEKTVPSVFQYLKQV